MANYIIEGTVSELSTNNEGKFISFKINGTEGYALQRKTIDKTEKFNVFSEENNGENAYIFRNNSKLECNEKFFTALTTAFASGKRIQLKIVNDKLSEDFKINDKNFGLISSVSLLSD